MVFHVFSRVSIFIELSVAIFVVSLDNWIAFVAFSSIILFVFSSSAFSICDCKCCLFKITAWARACLNTGIVTMNAELIFLIKLTLLYAIEFIWGIDKIATASVCRKSCTLCSSTNRHWLSLLSSNCMAESFVSSNAFSRFLICSFISSTAFSPAIIYLTNSW